MHRVRAIADGLTSAAVVAATIAMIGVRVVVRGDDLGRTRPGRPGGRRRAAWLPLVTGWLAAAMGAANVVSALTPEFPDRLRAVRAMVPDDAVVVAHAAVLPAGLGLLVLSVYLARGRRRALWLTVGLLMVAGALELLKGLDVEEAAAGWAVAGLLVWGRDAFQVRHEDRTLLTAVRRAAVAGAVAVAVAGAGVLAAAPWSSPEPTARSGFHETADLLVLSPVPVRLDDAFAWLPLGVGLCSVGALLVAAWSLFRPLCAPESGPDGRLRADTKRLVRRHGDDTLSAFKLRGDLQTLMAPDGRAFLSYRVERGVLLVSGDPVGPADAVPGLLAELRAFAAARGLRVGAVVASESFARTARDQGLHALYVGDEAVVSTTGFSLEGRAVRKVRQAVSRLEREGHRAEVVSVSGLSGAEMAELQALSDRWRAGEAERGFSMAFEGLAADPLAESVVVVARDADGRARGFLHFVPAYGRPVMSLSAMRRDRDAPNGITEFLVVSAIHELGARGIDELSLNFAAFARWLHSPRGRVERLLKVLLGKADDFFQVESLYRFNAKFQPRWQPRYLLYEGAAALPRTALAALWAEGQIPRPSLPAPVLRRLRPVAA